MMTPSLTSPRRRALSLALVLLAACDGGSGSDSPRRFGDGCDPACPVGRVCRDGACEAAEVPAEGCDPACGEGQRCQAGACVEEGAAGVRTCAQVLDCLTGCEGAEAEACVSACFASGTASAQQAAAALLSCLESFRDTCGDDQTCWVGVCEEETAACAADGGASGGGGLDDADVEPLPASAFVYVAHTDGSTADAIVIHDTATGQSRRLMELQEGQVAHQATDVALSPDRRWIAFGSHLGFRPTPYSDEASPSQLIWLLSVDGEHLVKVMSSIGVAARGACSVDGDCAAGMACDTLAGVCVEPLGALDVGRLSWTPDGSTLYFNVSYSSRNASGSSLARVVVAERTLEIFEKRVGCTFVDAPLVAPSGEFMVAHHAGCVGSDAAEGVYAYGLPPGEPAPVVVNQGTSLDVNTPLAFRPDGSALLFFGLADWDGNPSTLITASLAQIDLQSGQIAPVLDTEAFTFIDLAFSPDGSKLMLAGSSEQELGANRLYLVDLASGRAPMEIPVVDGRRAARVDW